MVDKWNNFAFRFSGGHQPRKLQLHRRPDAWPRVDMFLCAGIRQRMCVPLSLPNACAQQIMSTPGSPLAGQL